MKKYKVKNVRLTIQVVMLSIVTLAAISHGLMRKGIEIPWISESLFHYICPTCGVSSIYELFEGPVPLVVKLGSAFGIVVGLAIMSAVLFGPIICGFICPFGAIQDLLSRLGKKIFKTKFNKVIPKEIDNKLKNFRYFILVIAVILTATDSIPVLEALNPYHAYLSIFNMRFNGLAILGFIILALVVGLSLVSQRPWCKYLCPYGAFLGLFNKIKVFRVVREKNTCIGCKKCSNTCPMGIQVDKKEEVRDLKCISCMECVKDSVCPKDNTISFSSKDNEEEIEK